MTTKLSSGAIAVLLLLGLIIQIRGNQQDYALPPGVARPSRDLLALFDTVDKLERTVSVGISQLEDRINMLEAQVQRQQVEFARVVDVIAPIVGNHAGFLACLNANRIESFGDFAKLRELCCRSYGGCSFRSVNQARNAVDYYDRLL